MSFVHLHNHSEYSMLDSSAKVSAMVKKAKEEGMSALAITDHGNMYGALKFYKECKSNGIKPIIGCEIYKTNHLDEKNKERFHLILLAENNIGYHNLIKIVSEASKHVYYKPLVDEAILRKYHEGLICMSACVAGELPRAINSGNMEEARNIIKTHIDIFGKDNYYIEVQNHGLKEEIKILNTLFELANEFGLKVVATNDFHYINKEDAEAQDVLLCISTKKKLSDENRLHFDVPEFYFKTEKEMEAIFHNRDNCLSNTVEIAERCNVEIEMGMNLAPKFPKLPQGETETSYLRKLCEEALPKKYASNMEKATERMNYELGVIEKMHYSGYFLIVWDFINHARSVGISIGPGRGSGAGSIVCYLTGITELDPLDLDLLFERFLNPERVSMPDIDTDIADSGRSEIVDYMIKTYNLDKSAQISTFNTENPKGAIKDVARVLDLPYSLAEELSGLVPNNEQHITLTKCLEEVPEFKEKYDNNANVRKIIDIAIAIEGLPRSTGTHAAGVLISQEPLEDILPVEMQEDGFHAQYDKNEVEELGLLKMDLLGLKNLSILDEAKKLIKERYGKEIDFNNLPLDDTKTMEMLQKGDTFGVFQLESNGMTDLVRKIKPTSFRDLIPTVALYRPGPIGAGMLDTFVKCCHGEQEISYPHPSLEPVLKETYGVILYQEQVMKIVQVMAGFSLGKADLVRRAMGKKKKSVLEALETEFIEGCVSNNIDKDIAKNVFDKMMFFASYGFNKSHSAAYAYLAYETAYVKANYPLEYLASYVNTYIDDEKKVAKTINYCRQKGIQILPPDVSFSNANFKPENNALRYGLYAIKEMGTTADLIMENRPFDSLVDFLVQIKISARLFEKIAKINGFKSLFPFNPAILIENADSIYKEIIDCKKKQEKIDKENKCSSPLFDSEELSVMPSISSIVKKYKTDRTIEDAQFMRNEKDVFGFYISKHPLDFCQKTLAHPSVKSIEEVSVQLGGNVSTCVCVNSVREIYTKKGNLMAILDISDFSGSMSVIAFDNKDLDVNSLLVDAKTKDVLLLNLEIKVRDGRKSFIVKSYKAKTV